MNTDNELPEVLKSLPMLPVRDIVVFPYMILPLYVGREASIKAVEDALAGNRLIFFAAQKEVSEESPSEDSIYKTGTIATIMRMRKLSDGRVKILIQGTAKGVTQKVVQSAPFFKVDVKTISDTEINLKNTEAEALIRSAKESLEKIITLGKVLSPDILLVLDDVTDPGKLSDLIASNLDLKLSNTQRILETHDPVERLQLVNELLIKEIEVLQVQTTIRNTAKDEMSKSQREYFLREQMRAIKNELGDGDSKTEEIENLRERIISCQMPNDVEKEALAQLSRLEKMHPDSSETSMVRTYLETMVELPWNSSTPDQLDLKRAQKILDEDHYELTQVKERILEFLAVRQLKDNKVNGPILCFSGPPGVGKTSLGKSIARAMGRKYIRVSLGGVKDEPEIRGHRRTYVGAMAGKIILALKQIKSNNPVIVLDEIDKLGSDFRGDPSAAMLEVLDPEQNSAFRDNYLNVDFDLSNVLFLATANLVEDIPPALRDRMEVIRISGYTENDKLLIAKKHLIHKEIERSGISDEYIEFSDDGIKYLISHHTREAGLRGLSREIGSLCRKVAKNVVLGNEEKVLINSSSTVDLLGPPKFIKDEKLKADVVGITTGLAWTQVGGEVLYVEAIKMKGKGDLILTGQLGDVMKESAQAAMSYARANTRKLGIDENWFVENEAHVHIPSGAIPKDGPSAGITISTSLISIMTNQPIRMDIAMTGEITLSGRILPVGGVKEKALAALNHGITTIILPLANKKDIIDIPEEFKKKLNFIYVKHLDEVLRLAFHRKSKGRSSIHKKIRNDDAPPTAPAA